MTNNEIFTVYAVSERTYDVQGGKRFCMGIDNAKKTAEVLKREHPDSKIHYNKTYTCFDGYLEQGDYMGTL